MPSIQKTEYMKLNRWSGTDIPKRQDFVNDNLIIDQTMQDHIQDMDAHLSDWDRTKLNQIFFTGLYWGNGAENRDIILESAPAFLILYPCKYPMGKTEFQGEVHYNNFGFCTQGDGSFGISLRDATLTVTQYISPEYTYEMRRFNQSGVLYQYVAFR